jgi:hypothetical protein
VQAVKLLPSSLAPESRLFSNPTPFNLDSADIVRGTVPAASSHLNVQR